MKGVELKPVDCEATSAFLREMRERLCRADLGADWEGDWEGEIRPTGSSSRHILVTISSAVSYSNEERGF